MGMTNRDVNRINCRYFSRGTQLKLHKEKFLGLLPPEEILFPRYIAGDCSVLDLGCGAGRTTSYIRKMAGTVVGIDLSEALIEAAKEKYPDMDFRIMDAGRMDFPDNSFDIAVFSYNGLCYVYPEEKRITAIKEVSRVLKKGGIFIFSSFNRFFPCTLYSILNLIVTKVFMGFASKYTIHLTRYGITVNYETAPAEETELFQSMGFELIEQVPMTERVGMWGYKPAVLTYYAFKKL